jgi:hypothetical protein
MTTADRERGLPFFFFVAGHGYASGEYGKTNGKWIEDNGRLW